MSYGLNTYKRTSVHTASKEQILLMLYQAAIKHCKKGIEAIEKRDLAAKGESIGRFQDIIIELANSLDHEIGGDLAKELASLYDYLLFASTDANIKIDKAPLEACLSIVNTLYAGWIEAVKKIKQEEASHLKGKEEK